MPAFFFGVVVLVLVLWAMNAFTKANAKALATQFSQVVRPVGGVAALGVGAFIGLRGNIEAGIGIGLFGLGLLGWGPFNAAGFFQRTQKSTGQVSRVRSTFVEMELDHDSGLMRGRILEGRHKGVELDTLDMATLTGLLSEFDAESRALLAAYLDRREPSWRENAKDNASAGSGAASSGKMSAEEAYQILSVKPGATPEEIGRAHRSLMKKLHPDQGGSTYLAARVNEAKDVLLRRHR
jgi:DnaJ domain